MSLRALPRPWLPAALAALALAGAGCEAGVTQGTADQARSAAESFVDACAHKNVVAAMDILTPAAQAEFLSQGSGLDACVTFLGLAKPDEPLSPSERLDLLHKAKVTQVEEATSEQFATVIVQGPDGSHAIDAEQRGTLWHLSNPPLATQTDDPAARTEKTAIDFLDACVHEDAEAAGAQLVPPERESFRAAVEKTDVSTACLKLLDLTVPGHALSRAEREDLLDRTAVSDVQRIDAGTYSVTLEAPDGREREIDGEKSGTEWLLDRPAEAVVEATAETLLDACARGDAATVAKVLAPSARERFRMLAEKGSVAEACLALLDLQASGSASDVVSATKVVDVHKTAPEAYSVTVRAPNGRQRELRAEKSGPEWLLDRP